ncbi:DUF5994 family protein [Mycobacterium sp. HUMS_1102779]|uniref:DUF5994 family protein n=1 Tax=Mycobacterium sp. HUMS_1102779 TaxID=3383487 RepID=UPI003899B27F
MNRGVRGRRLASPVRIALAAELGSPIDGAWWPHTSSIAAELPELVGALSARLGEIIDISVNWSSLESSPDLDALNRLRVGDGGRAVGRQRLMVVVGSRACANVLVVPCRTSAALATMVLRQAAALPVARVERESQEFRTGADIMRAARTASARCGQRWPDERGAPAEAAVAD